MKQRPLLALLIAAPAFAQWINYPTPGLPRLPNGQPNLAAPAPRTTDGKPDLSGVWNRLSPKYRVNIAADLRPEEVEPWAKELVRERTENIGKDSMVAHCLPLGPQYATDADSTGGGMMKIAQTPGLILILNPDLTYRQIYLDGRKLETSPNPSWMGYSVGHWDGDTLVVESFGFNDRTWLDTSGHPHTEALRMTERYRRRDFGHMDLEVTLQDPAVYSRPWTVAVKAELAADTELLEYVCNENTRDLEHWVGKASDETKSEVKVAPEILAKYVRHLCRAAETLESGPPSCQNHVFRRRPLWRHGRKRKRAANRTLGNQLFRFLRAGYRIYQGQPGHGHRSLRQARVRRLPLRTPEVMLR